MCNNIETGGWRYLPACLEKMMPAAQWVARNSILAMQVVHHRQELVVSRMRGKPEAKALAACHKTP